MKTVVHIPRGPAVPRLVPPRSRDLAVLLAVDAGWLPVGAVAGTSAFVLPLAALDAATGRGDGPVAGTIVLVGFVLATAIQPLVGVLSDRGSGTRSRVPWILLGSVAVLAGLVALAVGLERASIAVAAAGSLVVQAAAGVIAGAQQPLLAELIARRRRGVAAGARVALELAAPVASFAIVAALVAAGAPLLALATLGATILAPLAAVPLLRSSEPAALASSGPAALAPGPPRPRWRGRRAFAWAIVARGLFVVAGVAVLRVLPAFVHASVTLAAVPQPSVATAVVAHPAGTLATGLAAVMAVVGAIFALPSGWLADRIGRRPPMVAGAWIAMCGAGALTMATDLTGLTIGTLLVAASAGLFLPAQLALSADLAPEGHEGAALGTLAVVTAAGIALSVIAAPISALSSGIDGLRLALAVTAVLFAGSGLAGLRAYRFLPASLAVDSERDGATSDRRPARAPERPRRT